MSDSGTALVAKIYEAWRTGDIDTVFENLTDAFEFDQKASREDTIYAGRCCGKQDLLQRLSTMQENWEFLNYTPLEILGDGDRVAARCAIVYKNRRNGQVLETELAHFWTITDGKASELVEFFDSGLVARMEPHNKLVN